MALEQQIQKDIMAAMKAKDQVRLNAVRSIKSAILLARTAEGASGELTDGDIVKLIQKLAKQRKEAAEQYVAAGRQELSEIPVKYRVPLGIQQRYRKILAYLPKQLTPEEVEAKLKEIIAEVGASAPSDMGKVMGVATKRLAGLADGKTISGIVRKLLG